VPRGVDYKIPLADLLQAAKEHEAGWSLRAIARLRWQQWGYASVGSALEGLRHALRTIDAPVRDRIEATIDASLVHGNSRRAMKETMHPEHARQLAHRKRRRRGELDVAWDRSATILEGIVRSRELAFTWGYVSGWRRGHGVGHAAGRLEAWNEANAMIADHRTRYDPKPVSASEARRRASR
jgi:hypothetical protein